MGRPAPIPTWSAKVSLAGQIQAVEREIKMRRQVYPNQVETRRMQAMDAAYQIAAMEAVLATLKALKGEGK